MALLFYYKYMLEKVITVTQRTKYFSKNPVKRSALVRISRNLAQNIVQKPREWSIIKNLNFHIQDMQWKQFTVNY